MGRPTEPRALYRTRLESGHAGTYSSCFSSLPTNDPAQAMLIPFQPIKGKHGSQAASPNGYSMGGRGEDDADMLSELEGLEEDQDVEDEEDGEGRVMGLGSPDMHVDPSFTADCQETLEEVNTATLEELGELTKAERHRGMFMLKKVSVHPPVIPPTCTSSTGHGVCVPHQQV
jgi:hypothetical protein